MLKRTVNGFPPNHFKLSMKSYTTFQKLTQLRYFIS